MNTNKEIWRKDAFFADGWLEIADDTPLPDHGDIVVSAERFLSECKMLLQRPFGGLGVKLTAVSRHEMLAGCINQLDLIVLDFPSFVDGRAYSIARTIREKYKFNGELRAVGEVLIDQLPFMQRCGFDSFKVVHAPTRAALEARGLPAIDRFYQPVAHGETAVAGRSWLRKSTGN